MSLLRQITPFSKRKKKKKRGPVDMRLTIVMSAATASSGFEEQKVRNDEVWCSAI